MDQRKFGHSCPVLMYSDAFVKGFGAAHQDYWCVGSFDPQTSIKLRRFDHHFADAQVVSINAHINVKEMSAVITAAKSWSPFWSNKRIVFVTDNSTVMAALTTGKCSNKEIMFMIKQLFWLSCLFNYDVTYCFTNKIGI